MSTELSGALAGCSCRSGSVIARALLGYLFAVALVPHLLLYAHAAEQDEPVRLIFDSDMGNDVDDALALAMIHTLESRGECQLLAVTVTNDHPLAAAFVDAMNRFYGRGDVPVGLVRDGVTHKRGKFLQLAKATGDSEARYPNRFAGGERAPDAVAVLRETLAAQRDKSVVIAQVGFSTNLARLLDTGPDDASSLGGRELVNHKVRRLYAMAGYFGPEEGKYKGFAEYNVVKDIASAQKLVGEWPTPIDFSGYEVGRAIEYPAESIKNDFGYVSHHPVVESYELYIPPSHNRPTWDLTSVLEAVRPGRDYFEYSTRGRVSIDDEGRTKFVEDSEGPHRYFTVTPEQIVRVKEVFCCLVSEPPRNLPKEEP